MHECGACYLPPSIKAADLLLTQSRTAGNHEKTRMLWCTTAWASSPRPVALSPSKVRHVWREVADTVAHGHDKVSILEGGCAVE